MDRRPKILPLGEYAVVVEFGETISEELNRRAIVLAEKLTANPFPGFIEAVPAYASTAVFYDVLAARRAPGAFQNASDAVSAFLSSAITDLSVTYEAKRPTFEITAAFDSANGPDLDLVSNESGLTKDTVIEVFTSTTYRVYMIGFLPGFAYMGDVDNRIQMPRKQQPRQLVPKGSIGIAGPQTGIYPLDSPGGWQIIGRTEIACFTPDSATPSLLHPGDIVRFVAV